MLKLVALALLALMSMTPAFADTEPTIRDPDFVLEQFVTGIPNSPTTMAFVGKDILVLQKDDGQVRRPRWRAAGKAPA